MTTRDPAAAVAGPSGAPGDVLTTGDLVIDAALRDLAGVDPGDPDGHIDAAEALQRTLQGRLADLGE